MQGKYREAVSSAELESIFSSEELEDCMIWQNNYGQRNVYEVQDIELKLENRELRIKVKNFRNDLDTQKPLYLKLNYRGTLVKAEIISISGSYITIEFPDIKSTQTIESRSEIRKYFDLNDDVLVTLLIKKATKGQIDHVLRFQIADISNSGICLIISSQNKKFMEDATEMFITYLGSIKLEKPISIEKLYIKDFRYKKLGKNLFSGRCGFRLANEFVPSELSSFLKKYLKSS